MIYSRAPGAPGGGIIAPPGPGGGAPPGPPVKGFAVILPAWYAAAVDKK